MFADAHYFPQEPFPHHPVRIQQLKRIRRLLAQEHIRELPDGRWLLWWQTNKPPYGVKTPIAVILSGEYSN